MMITRRKDLSLQGLKTITLPSKDWTKKHVNILLRSQICTENFKQFVNLFLSTEVHSYDIVSLSFKGLLVSSFNTIFLDPSLITGLLTSSVVLFSGLFNPQLTIYDKK